MRTKTKLILSVIAGIMIMIVIGLTIAIVLVAQQVNISNSMSVYYTVTDVSCKITPTATRYDHTNAVAEILSVTPNELVANIGDSANGEVGGSPAKVGIFEFGRAELTASGYVVYTFAITNTAPEAGEDLFSTITFDANAIKNQNITLQIGEYAGLITTENKATVVADMRANAEKKTTHTISLIEPQQVVSYVVIIGIENDSYDVDLDLLSTIDVKLVKDVAQA